jgi:hypothetical protein
MENKEYKIIGATIYEPDKQSEKAEVHIYKCCCNKKCPLLEQKRCIHRDVLGMCVYGSVGRIDSPSTKRGKSYSPFVKKYRDKIEKEFPPVPKGAYLYCVQEIGDYIYLPYPHMNHNDGKDKIPFLSHSHLLSSGSKFMKKEDFTVEAIVEILKLKPHAMMGGEITSYQTEAVPLFIFHLQKMFPKLFKEVVKVFPEIEEKVKIIKYPKTVDTPLKNIPIKDITKCCIGEAKVKEWKEGIITVCGTRKECGMWFSFKGHSDNDYFEISFTPNINKTIVTVKDEKLIKKICDNNPELMKG